ncbi:tetratricopeptide repeat protein [Costertonia aggregata]|uniref:histidine kinase n=2 Tax=Costertonia aggregata TaxID=343403 RepID=A0A7H9AVM2_9FLAO|nr:tetratricopeptide repeat protein [Costertonia aggregata]
MPFAFGQNHIADSLNKSGEKEGKMWFSTIPNQRQKSLEPYYDALKEASYGVQRFSIFDQLAEYHIKKGNTDSIMYYGNLYVKEIVNWDKTEEEKQPYYTKAYLILANGSKFNGLFENAIKWHFKGITQAEKANDTKFQYLHKIGLAKVYNLKGDHNKAIAVLEPSIKQFSGEWPIPTSTAKVYLGDAFYNLGNIEKAKNYYEKALSESIASQNIEMELAVKMQLGRLAENENRFEDALRYYDESRTKGLKEGFDVFYFEGSTQIGNLYYKQGNYDVASMILSTSYINALDRENLHYQAQILDLERKVFYAMNDTKNAYAVMTQLMNVRNQINEQQQKKISKELEVQYETLQKEKEILNLKEEQIQQESELKRQRTIKTAFLIGFLIILIPIIALLFTYYQKIQAQSELSKKEKEINVQKVASLKQEQELNLIKASIEGQDEERKRIAQELHDSIGGNLAGIKLQLSSISKGAEELKPINKQIDETYQLVRDISHTLIPKKFKQNAFTGLIKEYVRSIANTGKLEIGFHPYPEDEINTITDSYQAELFKIIQELMTNTLKHANADKVDIHLSKIDDELSLLFEDNGEGFDTSDTQDGIGFENMRSRVKGMKGNLNVDSTKHRGTVVSIEIPVA